MAFSNNCSAYLMDKEAFKARVIAVIAKILNISEDNIEISDVQCGKTLTLLFSELKPLELQIN